MANDNFGIDARYVARTEAKTDDGASGETYWTTGRIRLSNCYQAAVYALAERELRKRSGCSLVDVGCGPAPKLEMIHKRNPGVNLIGIDQRNPIDYCRRKYTWGTWLEADFANPVRPLAQRKGDVVVCADVIEHVLNPDILLEYIRQWLAPQGLLVISTPDRDLLWGPDCKESRHPQHVREWNAAEFRSYLSSRGFRVIRQVHQFPVRIRPNRLFFTQIILRATRRQAVRYNQVCLVEPL